MKQWNIFDQGPVVFVSGVPRSGTTAIGVALADAVDGVYLHEPFNPTCGVTRLGGAYAVPPATGSERERLSEVFREVGSLQPRLAKRRPANEGLLRAARRKALGGRSHLSFWNARLSYHAGRGAILKDPTAFLLAGELGSLGVKSLMILRSPREVVGSLTRLGWDSPAFANAVWGHIARVGLPERVGYRGGQPDNSPAALWLGFAIWYLANAEKASMHLLDHRDFVRDPNGAVSLLSNTAELQVRPGFDYEIHRQKLARKEWLVGPFGSSVQSLGNRSAQASYADLLPEFSVLDDLYAKLLAHPTRLHLGEQVPYS